MNIEQIAHESWSEVCKSSSVGQSIAEQFLLCCLSKLSEQAGEPVAYLTYKGYLLDADNPKVLEHSDPEPLYTESQLIAAQQKAAEACAKVCDDGSVKLLHFLEQKGAEKCAEALRFGEWREYL